MGGINFKYCKDTEKTMLNRKEQENAGLLGLLPDEITQYTVNSYLTTGNIDSLRSTCRFFASNPEWQHIAKLKYKKIFSGYHCSFLLDRGRLYGFGEIPNYFRDNQQGIRSQTGLCVSIVLPNQIPIAQIAYEINAADGYSIIRAIDGTVYAYGLDALKQLRLGHEASSSSFAPIPIPDNKRIRHVAFGIEHIIMLADDGTVFGCGQNKNGNLGVGVLFNRSALNPIPVPHGDLIKEVATGDDHTIMLSKEGKVYGCGKNTNGQLGIGSYYNQSRLISVPIPNFKRIRHVTACDNRTILLAEDGTVYGCGSNLHGALGINRRLHNTSMPTLIPIPKKKRIQQVAACNQSMVLLAEDGTVFGCGRNARKQLGIQEERLRTLTEIPLPKNSRIQQVAIGFHHLLMMDQDERLYGCGDNTQGALGHIQKGRSALIPIDLHELLRQQTKEEETIKPRI